MRPTSHRTAVPEKCCGTCAFAKLVANKLDLLCFHGDKIEVTGQSRYPVDADYVEMDGNNVALLEGDGYSSVWAGRVTDSSDICDEYVKEIGDVREPRR